MKSWGLPRLSNVVRHRKASGVHAFHIAKPKNSRAAASGTARQYGAKV
jgi:hypothetical protein